MSPRPLLEVFEAEQPQPSVEIRSEVEIEEARLAGYESGYSAGWEDCTAAQNEDQTKLEADVARALQGLAFTYHEARGHVLRSVEPFLREVVAKLLPEMAQRTLGPIVMEALLPLGTTLADTPITVIVNPASRAVVEKLLNDQTSLPFQMLDDPSFDETRVSLRLGETERQIDLAEVIKAISTALDSFFKIEQEVKLYG